jgi:hypothetical protein
LLLAFNMMPPNTPCGSSLLCGFLGGTSCVLCEIFGLLLSPHIASKTYSCCQVNTCNDTGEHSHSDSCSCPCCSPPESSPSCSTSTLIHGIVPQHCSRLVVFFHSLHHGIHQQQCTVYQVKSQLGNLLCLGKGCGGY